MEEEKLKAGKKHLRTINKHEPEKVALEYHSYYRGKIEIGLKAPVRSYDDFAIWYTPGVAEPSRAIKNSRERVFEYTNKGNSVAIVTDGTRVLGLGDVGAEAALPVMEGKAMLFKYLGGVDAFPLCLDTSDAEDIINTVKWVAPTFGGVNLEDIESPKCYYILERLQDELGMPVWHDDQQGTALVILAGAINALKVVGKRLSEIAISLVGAGAANMNVAKYLCLAGAKVGNMVMVDSRGILNRERMEDVKRDENKRDMCEKTNKEGRKGGIKEAMRDTDLCIALSTPGPGVIKKEWVADMADDAIVFACANPVPEIWPVEAEEGGARIVATGRSDFNNQVNNSLGFPAVFRGALDVRAARITDEMCIAAANAIARYTEEEGKGKDKGISESRIIPRMEESEMYVYEAVAVGMKAIEQGVAEKGMSMKALEERVREKISGKTTKPF
uniref:NAD-dependent malic enzyme n=1 Tax=Candidatus Methanophagaceae archaeon ANME-1 ERB6 TaxID=2759912 RepID=A0A7G9YSI5_9EURY|nr:NAD-dependent malic enzyme [Methanosarcinales archaeon ANME-1 ERB6]